MSVVVKLMGLPTLKRWGKRRVTGASGSVSPVAASVWVKAELTVEVESGEAVEMTGAALMVTANAWVAVFEALSVACNVKLEIATVVGVPVITHVVPVGAALNPAGKEPAVIAQAVTLPVALAVVIASLYSNPTVLEGSGESVVIVNTDEIAYVPLIPLNESVPSEPTVAAPQGPFCVATQLPATA